MPQLKPPQAGVRRVTSRPSTMGGTPSGAAPPPAVTIHTEMHTRCNDSGTRIRSCHPPTRLARQGAGGDRGCLIRAHDGSSAPSKAASGEHGYCAVGGRHSADRRVRCPLTAGTRQKNAGRYAISATFRFQERAPTSRNARTRTGASRRPGNREAYAQLAGLSSGGRYAAGHLRSLGAGRDRLPADALVFAGD